MFTKNVEPLTHTSEELFNIICTLAIAKSQGKLRALIQSGAVIGVYNREGYNPVRWLAMTGEVDAVWFLINKFNASVNDAIFGAAASNRTDLIYDLRQRRTLWSAEIAGAAHGEQIHLVEKLLADMNLDIYQEADFISDILEEMQEISRTTNRDKNKGIALAIFHLAAKNNNLYENFIKFNAKRKVFAIAGLAYAGHINTTELIMYAEHNVHRFTEQDITRLINTAIKYAAIGGQIEFVSELLDKHPDSAKYAAYGFACRDDGELVNSIIQKYEADKTTIINYAVRGAASSGHVNLLQALLEQGGNSLFAIKETFKNEHIDLLNLLLNASMHLSSTRNFMKITAERAIYELRDHYTFNRANVAKYITMLDDHHASIKHTIAAQFEKVENEKIDFLKSSIKDHNKMVKKSKGLYGMQFTAQELAIAELPLIKSKDLLGQCDHRKKLMHSYNLDYDDAQLWRESKLLHFMFLQGTQLIRNYKMNLDIFIHICSFIFNYNAHLLRAFFIKHNQIMPQKLHDLSLSSAEASYNQLKIEKVSKKLSINLANFISKKTHKTLKVVDKIAAKSIIDSVNSSKPIQKLNLFASKSTPIFTKEDFARVCEDIERRLQKRKIV